jgi:hypothetical protein
VRVWLDDVRDAPPGWVRAFTPEEVIEHLRTGRVTAVSLDHDLGLEGGEAERTGYTVLLWLEVEVGTGRWARPLPGVTIHTGNPVGRARMLRVLRTIHRLHAMAADRISEGPPASI